MFSTFFCHRSGMVLFYHVFRCHNDPSRGDFDSEDLALFPLKFLLSLVPKHFHLFSNFAAAAVGASMKVPGPKDFCFGKTGCPGTQSTFGTTGLLPQNPHPGTENSAFGYAAISVGNGICHGWNGQLHLSRNAFGGAPA